MGNATTGASPPRPPLLVGAAVAAVYFVAARAGLALALERTNASPVGPAAGIALAAVLAFGPRVAWPGLAVGAFLAHVWVLGDLASSPGAAIAAALATAAGSTVEPLAGAALVRAAVDGRFAFDRVRDTLAFVLGGALLAPVVGATAGVIALCASRGAWGGFEIAWLTWWLGDAGGVMVFAPLLLAWPRCALRGAPPARWAEYGLLVALIAVQSWTVFIANHHLEYVGLALIAWAVFRFGPFEAVSVILLTAMAAVAGTARGSGPFFLGDLNSSLLVLGTFVGALSFTTLLLSSAVAERALGLAEVSRLADELRRRVAERERAETTLRESEEKMRSLGEAAFDAIVLSDARGKITYWNPAAERMFGLAAPEALGRDVDGLLAPAPGRPVPDGWRSLRESGTGPALGRTFEMEGTRADGTTFPVEMSVSAFPLAGNWSAIAIVRDVSQRRSVEEQLREAQKLEAVGRLAGGIAHDFNNLLTAVLGDAEEIVRETSGRAQEDAREIVAAARRGAMLTRQLLTFSRRHSVEWTITTLGEIVGGFERILRRLIGEDVELEVRLDPGAGQVCVDVAHVEQVLLNLAVNARDAMPQGGRLVLETAGADVPEGSARSDPPPGRWSVLSVQDSGCGMTPEVLAHLFEPFFTTKDVGEGTGLGLSTVYGIVRRAGGEIRVTSEPGRGSTFRVYLPRVEARAPAHEAGEAPPRPVAGSETLLLAEDEAAVRRLAASVLRECGYTVLEASDGEAGLALAQAHPGGVHAVVADVVMPRLGGPELAQRLRRRWPGLRVLFMSGYGDRALPLEDDADSDWLAKPFTPALLARKVRDLLDRPGPASAATS